MFLNKVVFVQNSDNQKTLKHVVFVTTFPVNDKHINLNTTGLWRYKCKRSERTRVLDTWLPDFLREGNGALSCKGIPCVVGTIQLAV